MNVTYEEWRPAIGHVGFYEVSNLGRVRTVARCVKGRHGIRQLPVVILATVKGGRAENYLRVRLSAYGHSKHAYVHRLVCEAFHGEPPFPGALARHLNDVGTDNRADNLRWGDRAANEAGKDPDVIAERIRQNREARYAE